jgi:hypothetical protein
MYWYNYGFYREKPNEEAITLTDEEYNTIMEQVGNGGELLQDDNGRPYVRKTKESEEREIENLRIMRENHCFSIINRGQLWYNTLTESQKTELYTWYHAWLDVTETKVIPTKPSWLN